MNKKKKQNTNIDSSNNDLNLHEDTERKFKCLFNNVFNSDNNNKKNLINLKYLGLEKLNEELEMIKNIEKSSFTKKLKVSVHNSLSKITKKKFEVISQKFDNVKKFKNILYFKNIADSHSEGEDCDYFDYEQKWYSINPKSKFSSIVVYVKDLNLIFSLIFFPIQLVYFRPIMGILDKNYVSYYSKSLSNNYILASILIHFLLDFIHILTTILSFITGVHDKRNNMINYNLKYLADYYYNKNNLFIYFLDTLLIVFNIVTYYLLVLIISSNKFSVNSYGNYLNDQKFVSRYDLDNLFKLLLFDVIIFFKFTLLIKMNDWIHMDSVLNNQNLIIELSTIKNHKKRTMQNIESNIYQIFNDIYYFLKAMIIKFLELKAHFKVALYYFIFLHIFACLWIYIYQIQDYDSSFVTHFNWTYGINVNTEDFTKLYIASIYFCLVTLLSVGYGDIKPTNTRERVFVCIFMIFGCFLYSFLVTFISSVFKQYEKKYRIMTEKMKILNEINVIYNLDDGLYNRINNFINKYKKIYKDSQLSFASDLPSNLRHPIQKFIFSRLIKGLDFFNNREFNFIFVACEFMKVHNYEKNMKIAFKRQRIEEVLFIVKGSIILEMNFDVENYKLAKIISRSSYCEDIDIKHDRYHLFNIVSGNNHNEICTIQVENYKDLKAKFPNEVELSVKKNLFRNNMIEELRKGAEAFYTYYGTIKGFREFSMTEIDCEILRELYQNCNNNTATLVDLLDDNDLYNKNLSSSLKFKSTEITNQNLKIKETNNTTTNNLNLRRDGRTLDISTSILMFNQKLKKNQSKFNLKNLFEFEKISKIKNLNFESVVKSKIEKKVKKVLQKKCIKNIIKTNYEPKKNKALSTNKCFKFQDEVLNETRANNKTGSSVLIKNLINNNTIINGDNVSNVLSKKRHVFDFRDKLKNGLNEKKFKEDKFSLEYSNNIDYSNSQINKKLYNSTRQVKSITKTSMHSKNKTINFDNFKRRGSLSLKNKIIPIKFEMKDESCDSGIIKFSNYKIPVYKKNKTLSNKSNKKYFSSIINTFLNPKIGNKIFIQSTKVKNSNENKIASRYR